MPAQPTLYADPYANSYAADAATTAATGAFFGIYMLFWLAIAVLMLIAQIKVFSKAGRKWWEALIPFYNIYVLLEIVQRPGWWLILFFVPFVNFVVMIILLNDLSKAFGHGVGFTLGLLFLGPIFWLILGFNKDKYVLAKASTSQKPVAETDVKQETVQKAE